MSAEFKAKFWSKFLRLSVFPWCKERPQIVTLWVEWFGRLKWRVTDFETSLSFFFSNFTKIFAEVVS